MTDLRTAAQQALEALEQSETTVPYEGFGMARRDAERKHQAAITALRAALAEPEGGGNLPPPLPGDFDHGIGADRFKVVRGAFWWHVLIGDSPTEHGKFRSRASAEKMAADLLREFRNGAFVQHEAALAEPVQEPVALDWLHKWANQDDGEPETQWHEGYEAARRVVQIHLTAPPQRKPLTLTDEVIAELWHKNGGFHHHFARAIERWLKGVA